MHLPIPPEQLKSQLVAEGLVTPERFDALRAEADRKDQSLLDLVASERIADKAYLENMVAGMLGVSLANLGARKLNEEVLRMLPEDVARQRQVILFEKEEDGTIDAAMIEPNDLETVAFLRERFKAKIKPFLANPDDMNRGFVIYGFHSNEDFKKIIQADVQETLRGSRSEEEAATDLPIVAIVDNILSFAVSSRGSDVHVEALEDATLVRYRVDGILYEMIRMPKEVQSALTARIKILSGLKIDEHYKPQDGRFRYQVANQIVDVRVSIMPTYYGEKIVMRLLASAQKPLSLEELGMLEGTAKLVSDNLKKTYGMIIICGPTGSGKSTTLYALLNIINNPNVNIASVEDPVEYNMRYVNQSQINPQAGITFASGLRALLRQDPNIIMVGEIRDGETAGIAVQAALTGHLLLSSLHTNDAPSAVPRLFDLDVPPFLVASTLNLVFAQRLVRRICNSCISSFEPTPEMKDIITRELAATGGDPALLPKAYYKGKGCPVCGLTGYRGRFGIFEVLEVTDTIKEVMSAPQFSLDELTKAARKEGMHTMFEDGLMKVQLGMTTLDEVLRVIRE
jgi:type IV pilus assembly protein PilB